MATPTKKKDIFCLDPVRETEEKKEADINTFGSGCVGDL